MRAEQVDYFEAPDDACPDGEICISHPWFRYLLDGWSLESGKAVEMTVAGLSHTWIWTDAPGLVTLEETAGISEVDYLIVETDVFNSFVCTNNSKVVDTVEADVIVLDQEIEDSEERDEMGTPKCFSLYQARESMPE